MKNNIVWMFETMSFMKLWVRKIPVWENDSSQYIRKTHGDLISFLGTNLWLSHKVTVKINKSGQGLKLRVWGFGRYWMSSTIKMHCCAKSWRNWYFHGSTVILIIRLQNSQIYFKLWGNIWKLFWSSNVR